MNSTPRFERVTTEKDREMLGKWRCTLRSTDEQCEYWVNGQYGMWIQINRESEGGEITWGYLNPDSRPCRQFLMGKTTVKDFTTVIRNRVYKY